MTMTTTTRAEFTAATELMAHFGPQAAEEATTRASDSRDRGNVIHYCQWRQVARLIEILRVEDVQGTVH
jgi:hypothetical protein